MNSKCTRLLAAICACLVISGCAGDRRESMTSGDSNITLPAVSSDPESIETPAEVSDITAEPTDIENGDNAVTSAPDDVTDGTTSAEEEWVLNAYKATMYATDTLNVREKPSTEAKVVGQLNVGDEADVFAYTDGGWYAVNYNGGQAYVYGEYLSAEKPDIKEEELAIPEGYIFRSDDDYFFVVNKERHLPDDYAIETDFVQGSYELEIVAAYHCREMIEAAKADGIDLKVLSAYRTVEYQKNLFERNVKQRMNDYGMSYDEAVYDVSINIAPPGGSEHNAGLAADIIDTGHWDTYEEFENTEEFKWLTEHCTEYGFVLRYPKGKEDITGYIYEPWHYRYVGISNAEAVMASGLCLEEYFEQNNLY